MSVGNARSNQVIGPTGPTGNTGAVGTTGPTGAAGAAAAAGALTSVQVFTSSGTWTRPSGITKIVVEIVGGGGGGGGGVIATTNHRSAGGAGGGYSRRFILSPSASEVITIGAGGAAGANSNGGSGGTSSFGAVFSATGGEFGIIEGGVPSTVLAQGGIGVSGDLNLRGEQGGAVYVGSALFDFGSVAGRGGNAALNMGKGAQTVMTVATSGIPGTLYGGGGGGCASNPGNGLIGGVGAAGIVIVWEYT